MIFLLEKVHAHSTELATLLTLRHAAHQFHMIVYTDHDQQPLQFTTNIRGIDHFDFNSLNVAKVVGARPEPGQRAVHYLCYSALNDTWSRVGPAVSLRG
jgi:hypothetical protein